MVPTRELCVQVYEDMDMLTSGPPDERRRHLRRQGLRGPDRPAEGGRADRRRHPRAPHRPQQPATPRPLARDRGRARRGRQDARPRLPARHREDLLEGAGHPSHAALLGHDARPDRRPGTPVHVEPHPHPRDRPRRGPHAGEHQAPRLPGALARQGRGHRPHPAGRGPRQVRHLHTHQARRAEARRRA